MKKNCTINIKVDSNVKKEAMKILEDLGLNMSSALNIFLKQIVIHDGLPFVVQNKNKKSDSNN